MPKIKNENSASGIKAAVAAGATHVEIDGYITTDNVIYASHDGSLGKITTGSGYIEQKTSAEMETYRLTQYYDEKIPSLDEVSRMKTNLNLPQSRRFRPFRQMLARCIHIHLRSPLPKIIKNGGFEVASEFNGKKTIKTRQSSDVVHAYYERE